MALSKVNKAMHDLSHGKSLMDDMVLNVGPYANWEEFLVPAPMCIGIIGELICISTSEDFTLENNPPKNGFKLLNYPNSFRTSLVQVSNAAYDAFEVAQDNMVNIRDSTANVEGYLKNAVTILMTGTNEEQVDMLPQPLNNIDEIANTCLTLAESAEAKFIFVMSLTAELLEACTNARGKFEEELEETKIALQVAKDHKTNAEEQKKMAKTMYLQLQKSVKTAEGAYYKAADSMPSGWDQIGMNVVESLAKSFCASLDGAVKTAAKKCGATEDGATSKEEKEDTGDKSKPASIDEGTREAYTLAIRIQTFTDQLSVACVDANGGLDKSLKQKSKRIFYLKDQLTDCMNTATDNTAKEKAVKDHVVELCKTGVALCDKVITISKELQRDPEEVKTLVENIKSLQEDVMTVSSEGKMRIGSSPMETKGPNQIAMQKGATEDESAGQQAVQSARFLIAQTSENLKFTREKYDKACDRMMDTSTKLGEIMADMSKLNMKEVDFEKIRKTLIRGIKAIGQLREKWTKLVSVFHMMSSMIKNGLNTSLKDFLKTEEVTENSFIRGYAMTALKRDMIYQQAFSAAKNAHVVNMISGTYAEVSVKYLTGKMAGLSKLFGYNPDTEADKIRAERQKLYQDMEDVQANIRSLVKQRRAEFSRQVTSRINETRSKLEAAMPADASLPDQERITKAVQRGAEIAKVKSPPTAGMDISDFE